MMIKKKVGSTGGYNNYKLEYNNVRIPKYINQILRNQKGEIDNTIKEGH